MANKDLAIRKLAEHCLADIAKVLLPGRRFIVERVEEAKLKLVERLPDSVAFGTVDDHDAILHVEFEAGFSGNRQVPARLMAYNALLRQRHPDRAVISVVVYLQARPRPPSTQERLLLHPGDPPLDFPFEVFIPHEHSISVEEVARAPGLAPLAILTPGIQPTDLRTLQRILTMSAVPGLPPEDLVALTYLIGGHRFENDLLDSYLRSEAMETSSTYQAILREGRQEGRQEGHQEGRQEGRRETLVESISLFVNSRLGAIHGLTSALDALSMADLESLQRRLLACNDDTELRAALPA